LPALITGTEEVAPEIYPSREQMEDAQTGGVTEITASDLADDKARFGVEGSPTWVGEVYSFEPDRAQIIVRDKPVEQSVAELMEYLEDRRLLDDASETEAKSSVARGRLRQRGEDGAIWVVGELSGSSLRPITLQLLGRACELADHLHTNVEALLIGGEPEKHAETLAAFGADRVILAKDPSLRAYDTEKYTDILAEAIRSERPYAVIIPSTITGRDLAARVAGRLELGLTGDCIGLEVDGEGRLVQLKPAFGGNIVAPIYSKTSPQMATVRPGLLSVARPDWTTQPVVYHLPIGTATKPRVRLLESVVDESVEGAEIESARRIVAVGKGIGGPENLELIRPLAQALGASIGATREVTDLGWLPRQHQIGLSGKSVSPELYVAIGIRGVFNHTVGIQKSGTVVAVNNSARSPIFEASDIGILGDFREVVPLLTDAIVNRRSG
jgi:electron transfer flavoprotein alpha subunit